MDTQQLPKTSNFIPDEKSVILKKNLRVGLGTTPLGSLKFSKRKKPFTIITHLKLRYPFLSTFALITCVQLFRGLFGLMWYHRPHHTTRWTTLVRQEKHSSGRLLTGHELYEIGQDSGTHSFPISACLFEVSYFRFRW